MTLSIGPEYPGTGQNLGGIGTLAWTNPGNITGNTTSSATAALNAGVITNYLTATNFDFSALPNDAIIEDIELGVERASRFGDILDQAIRLQFNVSGFGIAALAPTNMADLSTNWPGATTWAYYKGLFGKSWTATEIKDSLFGGRVAALNRTLNNNRPASVRKMSIEIFYTLPGGKKGSLFRFGGL